MTQTRESLGIMDGGPPSITFSTKSKKGHHISKSFAFLLVTIYVTSIVATGFLVYNFATCPQIDIPTQVSRYMCNQTFDEVTTKVTTIKDDSVNLNKVLNDTQPKVNVRLPRNVNPIKYDVKLIPFIFEGNFTFNGEIRIVIEALEDTKNITLHAAELAFISSEVSSLNGSLAVGKVEVIGYANDSEKEFHIINLKNHLKKGEQYLVFMKYTGILNDDLHGFYRSSYKVGKSRRWLATTQFQPTDARRAFPCFDEPALKARFTISIAHPKNMSAISNMNSVGQTAFVEGLPDYVWEHFAESVPMSTYLVAFVVSDFAHKSDGNFSVWARDGAIVSAEYTLDIGPKILDYFAEFYQIKYPLPKLDMVALPDFNAGAMENWGLVTFRETAMLYDENISAKINKPRVATVVAHELAHQWFGNLVTPSWWSDLWLNEGFASYLEYVGIDAIEKSWKAMDQFVLHEVQNVFGLDALTSSHQISVEVGNPDEINEIFDRISYGKGAAIIRMMNHFLTTDVFTKGITNYLKSKEYQSSEQNDLWEALTLQARRDGVFDKTMSVKTIMETWTLQTGFPVINVKRDYVTGDITLNQERFMLAKNETAVMRAARSRDPQLWWVPITYTTRSKLDFVNTKPEKWMKGQKELQFNNKEAAMKDDWVIFNIQQTGFYRVNYDEHNWRLIIRYLNDASTFQEIPPSNRAQILDDALNLALGGKLDYTTALEVTKYLVQEREYVPWKAGLVGLGYLDGMLAKGPHYLEYKKYLIGLISDVYNDVGFTDNSDDSMLTIYKRIDIINIACLLEYDDCVTQAVTQFHNWMMTPNPDVHNPISPNLRNTVYCTAVRVGGETQWNFVRERFARSQTGSERELLLTSLGCTRLPWLLFRYLDQSCRNDSGIRKQDVYRVFGAVSNSVIGQPIAFSWIRENWTKMKTYLGPTASNLNTIVKYSTRKLNAQHELEELRKFAKERKGELGRTIDQAVERTEANVVWMNRNYDKIVVWLKNTTLSS